MADSNWPGPERPINRCRDICEGHSVSVADMDCWGLRQLSSCSQGFSDSLTPHILQALGNGVSAQCCQALPSQGARGSFVLPRRSVAGFCFYSLKLTLQVSFSIFSPHFRQFSKCLTGNCTGNSCAAAGSAGQQGGGCGTLPGALWAFEWSLKK